MSQNCYLPNGTSVDTSVFAPCPPAPGRTHSMCCATENRGVNDYCVKDANGDYTGMCLGGSPPILYRNSCTDADWGPDCLDICTQGDGTFHAFNYTGDMRGSDWPVIPCGDGTYCCGDAATVTNCCFASQGFYIQNNKQTSQKPASLTGTGAAATVTVSTSKISGGAIAGSVVGGLVVGFLIAAVAFFVYTRMMARKQPARAVQGSSIPMDDTNYGFADRKEYIEPPAPHEVLPQEAPNTQAPAELGGQPKEPSGIISRDLR